MPETYSTARPNTRFRLRHAVILVGLGSAALLLSTASSEPHASAQHETQQITTNDQVSVQNHRDIPKRAQLAQTEPRERAVTSRQSQRSEQPNTQCWDGDINDLDHVLKEREKRALANIAIACEIIADEAWFQKNPDQQIECLVELWDRESGWDESALNASSGAGGIPQAMPRSKMKSSGKDWKTNPATQIKWGIGYINTRYKTPCRALDAHDKQNWY